MGGIVTLRYAEALDFLLGFFNIDIANDDGRKLGGSAEDTDRHEPREPREPKGLPRTFDPTQPRRLGPRWEPRPLKASEEKAPPPKTRKPPQERKLPETPAEGKSWFEDE